MKLTEKQAIVVNYLKKNGKVTLDEICNVFDSDAKHVRPIITTLGVKGMPKNKGLCDYEKDEDGTIYVFLTAAGKAWVPTEDAE